jgi:hypothetical protein
MHKIQKTKNSPWFKVKIKSPSFPVLFQIICFPEATTIYNEVRAFVNLQTKFVFGT